MKNIYGKFLVLGMLLAITACSEEYESNLQGWPQCPGIFDAKSFDFYLDNPQDIDETLPLQLFISTLTALYKDVDLRSSEMSEIDDMDIQYEPLSITPSEDCNGLVVKNLMAVGERVSDEKIEAVIVLTQGMPYRNAPDICSEQNMIWMKELDYTQRVITTLKSGRVTNDFTFDLSQCQRWQDIEAYKSNSD